MTSFLIPDSIPADGSENVTSKLQAFIDSVPDGSTIEFPLNGLYRSNQTLFLNNRNNLTIDGQGSTLFTDESTGDGTSPDTPSKEARTRAHIRLIDGKKNKIHNLNIRGVNFKSTYRSKLEAQHGFDIQGSDVEIFDCKVESVYGDFAYWGKSLVTDTFSTGYLHDCDFNGAGRQGVSFTAAQNVIISNNKIQHVARSMFDIEPLTPNWGAYGIVICGNTIGIGRLMFVSAEGVGPADNITISGNKLYGHAMNIAVHETSDVQIRRKNWLVENNVSDTSWGAPAPRGIITMNGIDNLVVKGNVQAIQAGRGDSGVGIVNVNNAEITGNSFINAASVIYPTGVNTNIKSSGNQLIKDGPYNNA